MWKREGEDWIERRGGRGYATEQPGTLPPVTLPASTSQGGENTTTTTQALAAGFVPPHFHDEPPKTPYAGQPGKQTVTTVYDALRKEDKYRKNRRDLCWVTLLGIAEDQVMNIRDYIDTYIGRTTGHYVPAGRVTRENSQSYNACSPSLRPCYLQFASHVVAAQVVHAGVLRVELAVPHQSDEKKSSVAVAAAAEGGSTARRQRMGTTIRKSKLAVHAEAAGFVVPSRKACNDDEEEEDEASESEDRRTNMPSYLEVAVSWCTDEAFLRQRDRMSLHGRREEYSDGTSATHRRQINENNADGLGQQMGHHSNNAREQSEHDDAEEDASQTARSVTMTYRDNENSRNNNNSESIHAYGASGSNREVANGVQDTAQLQQRNSKVVRQADEGIRSALKYTMQCDATASAGNMSVLSLFYTQSTSNVWHVVLRCLLLIPLTLFRLLALLTGKWTQRITAHAQQTQNKTNDADTSDTNSIHMYRQCHNRHDETLMDDVSIPALQDVIASLFYRCIPFAPTTEEVDLALWAFETHRTLMADDKLARLQEHLRAIAHTNAAGALNVSSGKCERQSRRGQGMNVLCTWRPVWWFTRYTLISMLVVIGLTAYMINIRDKKSNESYTL